jgi:hypothetical protein
MDPAATSRGQPSRSAPISPTDAETARAGDHGGVEPAPRSEQTVVPPSAHEIHRPGPIRWLWYAFGGTLPRRYAGWVYRDTTTRTWALRHLARSIVQLALPIALVLIFVPGPFWIRGMAALGGVFLGMFFSLAYMPETVEHRLVRAGFPTGTATAARHRAAQEREAGESVRRRAAASRRAARYRSRSGH